MCTQHDIAKRLGISISAVSAAFKRPKHVSMNMREKIMATAAELGYHTPSLSVNTIGLLFENFQNHFMGEYYHPILFGVFQHISEKGFRLQIFEHFPEQYNDICDLAGFLVIGNDSYRHTENLRPYHFPYVLVECTKNEKERHHRIIVDNYQGVRDLTDYLLSCQHTKICFLNGETDTEDYYYRNFVRAICDSLNFNGRSDKDLLMYQASYMAPDTLDIQLNRMLSDNPKLTCIMCSNDQFAYRTIQLLRHYGYRVPEDISVTGFDGLLIPSWVPADPIDLTSVHVDRPAVGRMAVDHLADIISNIVKTYKIITFPGRFHVGKTVARIGKSSA